MSEEAQIQGYINLHAANKQANTMNHWRRVMEALKRSDPKLHAKVEAKIK